MDEDKYVILSIKTHNDLTHTVCTSEKHIKEDIYKILSDLKNMRIAKDYSFIDVYKADSEEYHQRKAELELIRVLL